VVQQVGSEQTQLIGAWQQGWGRMENLVEAVWLRLLQRIDAGGRKLTAAIDNLLHRSVQIAQSVAAQFRQVGQDLVRGLRAGVVQDAGRLEQTVGTWYRERSIARSNCSASARRRG
jgi:hypothetical protein